MKIFGIYSNYPGRFEEAAEPVVFLKADSSVLKNGKPFFLPDWAGGFDYEANLVLRVSRLGKGIAERFAHRYYDAVTVGVDFTARDLYERARSQGLPWAMSKSFDGSAAIGEWQSLPTTGQSLPATSFRLDVNGQTVQQGDSAAMLFSADRIISHLSRFLTLRQGDIIFTGTPIGSAQVSIGDHLKGYIGESKVLDFYCR